MDNERVDRQRYAENVWLRDRDPRRRAEET